MLQISRHVVADECVAIVNVVCERASQASRVTVGIKSIAKFFVDVKSIIGRRLIGYLWEVISKSISIDRSECTALLTRATEANKAALYLRSESPMPVECVAFVSTKPRC
jgi:hypothetical protein